MDDWLAGVEAAYEGQMDAERPRVAWSPAPDGRCSVTVSESDPVDVPRHEPRPGMDRWLDGTDELLPLRRPDADVRRRVERGVAHTEAGWSGVDHPHESAAAQQADQPAPAGTAAVLVTRLGEMDDGLLRVGATLAAGDAAFSRVVRRWHPI